MKTLLNFYNLEESSLIIKNYKEQYLLDIEEVLGLKLSTEELTPQMIFYLNHKSQLNWLNELAEEIGPEADFHHDIFEILTDSEYSQGFLEMIQNPEVNFKSAVKATLEHYELQLNLINNYFVTPQKFKNNSEVHPRYQLNHDLGDYEDDDGKIIIGGHTKSFEQTHIALLDQTALDSQITLRVEKTLSRLQNLVPQCFKRLETFTKYLVPTFSPGMVSFSSESLPFYSCINFIERDDVDLLDDLLHENGHHQLNFFLYCHELIDENDPNLYFSPWRESLRPLRGLYHGFCTFFWALDLFFHLLENSQTYNEFTKEQIEKMIWRFHEEELLLSMSYPSLQLAHKRGFISKEGIQIADSLFEKIQTYKNNCHKWELNATQNKRFQQLREELEIKRQESENSL